MLDSPETLRSVINYSYSPIISGENSISFQSHVTLLTRMTTYLGTYLGSILWFLKY